MSFLHFTVTVIFLAISSLLPLHTLAYFHLIFSARKYRNSSTKKLDDYPVVTVQLPIYNERYVVKRLLESVCMLDYPKDKLQIIVVDDSDDETAEICGRLIEHYRSMGYWIMHLRRGSRAGYKAGALQEALKYSRGEFIAIFDADFAPPRDFLKKALQHFTSDDIGLVQARWGHLNRDYSALTAAQALSLDLHFKIEQAGRNASGLFINFNGTAGVWRKKCIEDAGGWLPSLAEDLDLSYRAQLRGWRLMYIDDLEAPAELPVQMNASRRQQYRWAFGSFQTALRYIPNILNAKINALTKIHAVIHLTRHLPQLLLLLQVIMIPFVIKVGLPTRLDIMMAWLMLYPIVIIISMLMSSHFFIKKAYNSIRQFIKDVFLLILFGTGISLNNSIAIIHALVKRDKSFSRTPKFGIRGREGEWRGKKYALPFEGYAILDIVLGMYVLFAALLAFYSRAYSFMPLTLIVAISLLYIGILTIIHSITRRTVKRLKIHSAVLIPIMLVFVLAGFIVVYAVNVYRVEAALAEIERASTSISFNNILESVKSAFKLLPDSGNLVWLFPTAGTDFTLIKRDLTAIIQRIDNLQYLATDIEYFHAELKDIRDALGVISIQLRDIQPYAWITLTGVVVVFITLLSSIGVLVALGERA